LAQSAQNAVNTVENNLTKNYVSNDSLNTTLGNYVKTNDLNTTLGSYATTEALNTVKNDLLGTVNTDGNTIYGALKKAAAAQDAADNAQTDANTGIANAKKAQDTADANKGLIDGLAASKLDVSKFNEFTTANTNNINDAKALGQ
jgi:hypothetical protein